MKSKCRGVPTVKLNLLPALLCCLVAGAAFSAPTRADSRSFDENGNCTGLGCAYVPATKTFTLQAGTSLPTQTVYILDPGGSQVSDVLQTSTITIFFPPFGSVTFGQFTFTSYDSLGGRG